MTINDSQIDYFNLNKIDYRNDYENDYENYNTNELNEKIRMDSIISEIKSVVGPIDIDIVLFKNIIRAEDYDNEKCLERYFEFYEGTEMTENKGIFFTDYLINQRNFSQYFSDYNRNVKNDIHNYNEANNVGDNSVKIRNSVNDDNLYEDINGNEDCNSNKSINNDNIINHTDENNNRNNNLCVNENNNNFKQTAITNSDKKEFNALNNYIDSSISDDNVSTSVRTISFDFDISIEKERIDLEFAKSEIALHKSNLNKNANVFHPRSEIDKKNKYENKNKQNYSIHSQKDTYLKMFNDLIEEKILGDFWLETYSQVVSLNDNHENQRKMVDSDFVASDGFDDFGVNFVSDVMNRAVNLALTHLDGLDLWMDLLEEIDMMDESDRFYDKDNFDNNDNSDNCGNYNDKYNNSNYFDDFSDEEFDNDEVIARIMALEEENAFFNSNINHENNFEKNSSTQNVLLDMVKNIFGNNNCKYSDKLMLHVLKDNDYNIEASVEALMIYKNQKSLSLRDFQNLNNDLAINYNYKTFKNKDNKYTDFSYANILNINRINDHNNSNNNVNEKNDENFHKNIRNYDDNVNGDKSINLEIVSTNVRTPSLAPPAIDVSPPIQLDKDVIHEDESVRAKKINSFKGKEYQWRLVASKEGQRMKESFKNSIQISGNSSILAEKGVEYKRKLLLYNNMAAKCCLEDKNPNIKISVSASGNIYTK